MSGRVVSTRAHRMLAHEQLLALGGPHHGELLPITCGADLLMTAHSEPVNVTQLGDPFDIYQPGPLRNVPYRRTRILFDNCEPSPTLQVLLCDGYVFGLSGYRELVERLGIALMVALCGGAVWHDDFAVTWYERHVDDGYQRAYPQRWAAGDDLLSVDTWSQVDRADLCWRCDATPSTTDVGLCGACLVALQEVAA